MSYCIYNRDRDQYLSGWYEDTPIFIDHWVRAMVIPNLHDALWALQNVYFTGCVIIPYKELNND